MKTNVLIFVAFISIITNVSAQTQIGYTLKNDSIQSVILNQNRVISIYLPEGYDEPDAKFPVIYFLDASSDYQHLVSTVGFLSLWTVMPKVIIVGVFNINRDHDFLPVSSQFAPDGGGGDNFIKFFKKELIPYIDKNFKTESYKVLVGHSFGGVFAMYTFLSNPDLFDAYIVIDPTLWYNNQMIKKTAETEFLKTRNWDKTLFITGRTGNPMKEMAIAPMEELLKKSAPKDLRWKVEQYSGEDHLSVAFKSMYDGLRFIFRKGVEFNVYPHAGILPKGASSYALIENWNSFLHYTIDGTEPTINSPLCKDAIKINKACTLKIKSIATKYKPGSSVARIFTEGAYMSGQQSIENIKHGLKYSYYEGVWDSIPDFSKHTPRKAGVTDSLNLNVALKKDSFAIQFEGYIHITKKALYNLAMFSDKGSKLYFNNQLLLNNDCLNEADRDIMKLVPLNPGYYPIKLQYLGTTGNKWLSLGYVVGTNNYMPISKEMFFYQE